MMWIVSPPAGPAFLIASFVKITFEKECRVDRICVDLENGFLKKILDLFILVAASSFRLTVLAVVKHSIMRVAVCKMLQTDMNSIYMKYQCNLTVTNNQLLMLWTYCPYH